MSFKSIFKNQDEKFWDWFLKNEDEIFNFDKNIESVFDKLTIELRKVNKNLAFEFGPITEDGKREFVISADGIKEIFPIVERLYKKKPPLTRWIVVMFRPRRYPINDLTFGNRTVRSEEVNYILIKDSDPKKVGIMLFFKDFSDDDKNIFWQIGYFLLDEALGEYDVETKVGAILFESSDSEYYKDSFPLIKLAQEFDEYFKQR